MIDLIQSGMWKKGNIAMMHCIWLLNVSVDDTSVIKMRLPVWYPHHGQIGVYLCHKTFLHKALLYPTVLSFKVTLPVIMAKRRCIEIYCKIILDNLWDLILLFLWVIKNNEIDPNENLLWPWRTSYIFGRHQTDLTIFRVTTLNTTE